MFGAFFPRIWTEYGVLQSNADANTFQVVDVRTLPRYFNTILLLIYSYKLDE